MIFAHYPTFSGIHTGAYLHHGLYTEYYISFSIHDICFSPTQQFIIQNYAHGYTISCKKFLCLTETYILYELDKHIAMSTVKKKSPFPFSVTWKQDLYLFYLLISVTLMNYILY